MAGVVTVTEAARILKISRRRINWYITHKRLPATATSAGWIINKEDLDKFTRLKPGRPVGS